MTVLSLATPVAPLVDLTHFVIKATPDTANADGMRVECGDIDDEIRSLSGRSEAARMVLPQLRGAKVRAYVACNAGSPHRLLTGRRGFIVEIVRPAQVPS